MQKEIPQHALHRKTVFREGGKRLKHSCGIIFQWIPFTPSLPSAAFPHVAENGFSVFDMMGAGKPDEGYGVRDFKARFGGKLVEEGRFVHIAHPLLYKIGKWGVKLLKKI